MIASSCFEAGKAFDLQMVAGVRNLGLQTANKTMI